MTMFKDIDDSEWISIVDDEDEREAYSLEVDTEIQAILDVLLSGDGMSED